MIFHVLCGHKGCLILGSSLMCLGVQPCMMPSRQQSWCWLNTHSVTFSKHVWHVLRDTWLMINIVTIIWEQTSIAIGLFNVNKVIKSSRKWCRYELFSDITDLHLYFVIRLGTFELVQTPDKFQACNSDEPFIIIIAQSYDICFHLIDFFGFGALNPFNVRILVSMCCGCDLTNSLLFKVVAKKVWPPLPPIPS